MPVHTQCRRGGPSPRRRSAAVWTRDVARAHRPAAELRAGTVWVNCYNIFDAALPFRGLAVAARLRCMRMNSMSFLTISFGPYGPLQFCPHHDIPARLPGNALVYPEPHPECVRTR